MENNNEKEIKINNNVVEDVIRKPKKEPYPALAVVLVILFVVVGCIIVGSVIYFNIINNNSSQNNSQMQNNFSQNYINEYNENPNTLNTECNENTCTENNNNSQENKNNSPYQSIDPFMDMDLKPIIYIYPTKETNVTVTLGRPENLTHTYPKYIDSWNALATPDGNLYDSKTDRNYYSLYWEGKNIIPANLTEGFIVEGKDTTKFLEEKLAILGLNEREINEFIIYWLPQLENNKYNFIRFQTMDEINYNMPIKVTPTPDTLIRVMMEFKPLEEKFSVKEQILTHVQRTGYTVVEWGGTQIN